MGFPGSSDVKESAWMHDTWIQSLGWEDPLEKAMATYSSVPAFWFRESKLPGSQLAYNMLKTQNWKLPWNRFSDVTKPMAGYLKYLLSTFYESCICLDFVEFVKVLKPWQPW